MDKYFQTDKNGNDKSHIYLNTIKLATINEGQNPYYILGDHLGSNNILTTSTGNIAQMTDYEDYGKIIYESTLENIDNDYKFTGKEVDSQTDLQYFGARYLDNEIGRFISVDPAVLILYDGEEFASKYDRTTGYFLEDPQNLNSYSYVVNNPVKNTDPDGEILDTAADIGFIAYDLYSIGKNYIKTGHVEKSEFAALGADIGGAALPGVTGLGLIARTAKTVDKGVDVAKATDNIMSHSDDLLKVTGDVPTLKVSDTKLQKNYIDQLFKKGDEFIGGTATAIRKELNEKVLVGGKSHLEKGGNMIRGLEKWINNNTNAVKSDINTAKRVLNDLIDSFK